MQTVETLMRRRILRRLIWVYTVCQLSVQGYPCFSGLNLETNQGYIIRGFGRFSAIFDKVDNYCDFLITFLYTNPFLKRDLLLKEFAPNWSKFYGVANSFFFFFFFFFFVFFFFFFFFFVFFYRREANDFCRDLPLPFPCEMDVFPLILKRKSFLPLLILFLFALFSRTVYFKEPYFNT